MLSATASWLRTLTETAGYEIGVALFLPQGSQIEFTFVIYNSSIELDSTETLDLRGNSVIHVGTDNIAAFIHSL